MNTKLLVFVYFLVLFQSPCDGDFLSDWMGNMLPVLQKQTLLDLSLPGTHDSLTYDLSTTVSLGADDDSTIISWILHYASELGFVPSDWIRNQSKTQGLDITSQLDNGVRFIDFRIMYTDDDWYGLHFMETNQKAITYFTQIRNWLDKHPQEIVVMWLSKHGSACKVGNDQYPGVSIDTKQTFWGQITEVFRDLMVDFRLTPVNATSIGQLITLNRRVVIYATDYKEFTNESPYAIDGCLVDNTLCSGVENEVVSYNCLLSTFGNATQTLKLDKQQNKFFLLSMASSGSGEELQHSFLAYLGIDRDYEQSLCAKSFHIPGMTDWCPPHLQDISQLTNFYNQIPLEAAFKNRWSYPNAIYLDAVDIEGTIRTGTELFRDRYGEYNDTRYAYVATLLSYNLRTVCGNSKIAKCVELGVVLDNMRAKYPLRRWADPAHGRWTDWPEKNQ